MKRWVAILLAALMLLASAASAETVSCITLYNLSVEMEEGESTQSIIWPELVVELVTGGAESGIPSIELDAYGDNGNSAIAGAVLQVQNGKAVFTMDGLDDVYGVSTDGIPADLIPTLGSALTNLAQTLNTMALPQFTGFSLPMIPLATMLENVGWAGDAYQTEEGATAVDFVIPSDDLYSIVNGVLVMVPETALNGQLSVVRDTIDSMKASGEGIEIRGYAEETGDSSDLVALVYPVQNGVASEDASFGISMNSVADDFTVVFSDAAGDTAYAYLTLTTDASRPSFALSLSLVDAADIVIGLLAEDATTTLLFDMSTTDESSEFLCSFSYGVVDDVDEVSLYAGMIEDGVEASIIANVDTLPDENGERYGNLDLNIQNGAESITLYSNLLIGTLDAQLRDPIDASGALDVQRMSAEEREAMQQAISAALADVLSYLQSNALVGTVEAVA